VSFEAEVPPDRWAGRACAWPRRPQSTERVRILAPEELRRWIVFEDERLLVVDKPGDVVCHPSKSGPWSSLVGALRELTGLPTVHLVFRLDRETSGLVVVAKDARAASRLQTALQERRIGKVYLALLTGRLETEILVDQPLGDDLASPVFTKSAVVAAGEGKTAVTRFQPLAYAPDGSLSLVRVVPVSGRKHQIRAHAQWLGQSVLGDKIYGPDARLYLEFITTGWTAALATRLVLPRQALHCAGIDLTRAGFPHVFSAPLAADISEYCERAGLPVPAEWRPRPPVSD
jgi:23S rRNA pseudouridine1911/1915/1917 synthase